jgi:hypothetical protein
MVSPLESVTPFLSGLKSDCKLLSIRGLQAKS